MIKYLVAGSLTLTIFLSSYGIAQNGDQRFLVLVPTALNIVRIDDPDDFRFAIGSDAADQYLCVHMAYGGE